MLESAPRLWIARRSLSKAVDPGKLDNLVGGGIGWGYGIVETLLKECWEESGIPAELAARATPGRRIDVLAEIPEGVQSEQTFVYDLPLPADFIPANQDGEVSEHCLVTVETALALIAGDEMTVDASLVTLDWLLRAGLVEAGTPELTGIEALLRPF
jgi:8-oxo-dGTP pyrophosphatase MutT (NUDIX family)